MHTTYTVYKEQMVVLQAYPNLLTPIFKAVFGKMYPPNHYWILLQRNVENTIPLNIGFR